MDVDANEENFLDDSEDTGSDEVEEEQQQTQTQNQKQNKKGFTGKSNTIRLQPVPRGYTESHIYDFIMTAVSTPPLSISFAVPNKRLGRYGTPLFDAQFAFIVLASPEDAALCKEKLHQQQFADVSCSIYPTAPTRKHDGTLRDNTNWIKLTNLSKTTDEQQILTHIQQNGGIKNRPKHIYLHHNEKKDNYPGFAFIELANPEDATKCVVNMRNTELDGNKVWCSWRPIRKDMDRKQEELEGKTKQLVLANLHYTLQQNDIIDLCKEYGQVEHVQIWYDKSGYTTGCASITMGSIDDAKNVFEGLHDKKVKNLKVFTAYTKITSSKQKQNRRLSARNKKMSKQLVKNKHVIKKLRNNTPRAGKNRRGGKIHGRRDGVGGGGRKRNSNAKVGFAKKMGRGRGGGRGRGRGRGGARKGPKFA